MIDAHCHLQFSVYENDLDQVIKRADEKGVEILINSSSDLDSSKKAIKLAEKYNNIFAIVGIHPNNSNSLSSSWENELLEIAKSSKKVVGIGEIGLDYFSHDLKELKNKKQQKEVFIKQIKIADKLNLPIQVHNRLAGLDIIEIINSNWSNINNRGMFHCMSGDVALLKKVLDLGFYVGFDGNITYKGIAKGEDTPLSELVKNTPIDRIITETDSPYLSPIPYRGSRNEPSHVIIVGEEVAKIKGLDVNFVNKKTTENAIKLFKLNHYD